MTHNGLTKPYMGETGGILPTGGGDFMGDLKTAMENHSGDLNSLKSGDVSKSLDVGNSKDAYRVDKTDTDARMSANRDKVKPDTNHKDSKTAKADGNSDVITPEQTDAINQKTQEVVNKVAEEMDVAPEEVLEAMEVLGLSMVDLLDPNNMTDLVAFISGNQDTISLLTDENLYQTLETLKDYVGQITEDLSKELDLSQEALDMVLEQAEELLKQTVMTEDNPKIQDGVAADAVMVEDKAAETELPLEGMKDFKTTAIVDGKEVTMSVEVDEATGVAVTSIEEAATQSEYKGSSEDNKPADEKEDNSQSQVSLFTQTTQLNNIDALDISQMTEQVAGFRDETLNIANQILDSMKANLKPEMTELEMNLHPASLGNVRVSLTSQNGQITAQFIAQNETVRAAIESQVATLTNQLEEQGIKVEHVEVAVGDHRFDRGTGDDAQGDKNPENKSGKAKAGRIRRIDLSALDEEMELDNLEESDRIAAEMMAHDGNTVDYTV